MSFWEALALWNEIIQNGKNVQLLSYFITSVVFFGLFFITSSIWCSFAFFSCLFSFCFKVLTKLEKIYLNYMNKENEMDEMKIIVSF